MILKNKKGVIDNVIFITGIILIVIIAIIFLASQHKKVMDSFEYSNLVLNLEQEKQKTISFREQVAESALVYSFIKSSEIYFVDFSNDCALQTKNSKNYVIFNDVCWLNEEFVKSKFLGFFSEYFGRNFNSFKSPLDFTEEKEQFSYEFSEDLRALKIIPETKIVLKDFSYEMVKYEVNYEFLPEIEMNLSKQKISLEEIFTTYNSINEKLSECPDSECFDLSLTFWDDEIIVDENYVFVELVSKEEFFIEDGLKKISVRFCFKK